MTTTLTSTIKNITYNYIFINCFISATYMQNFIDFHRVVFEIFSFFVLKLWFPSSVSSHDVFYSLYELQCHCIICVALPLQQECPNGADDFRKIQCSEYNTIPFRGRFFSWVPFTGSKELV